MSLIDYKGPAFRKTETPEGFELTFGEFIAVEGVVSDPPASPVEGQDFAIGANASGAWAGQEGGIARATASGWLIFSPGSTPLVYSKSARRLYDIQAGVWDAAPAGAIPTTLDDLADVELDGSGDALKKDAQGVWRDDAFPSGGGGGASFTFANLSLASPMSIPHAGSGTQVLSHTVPSGVSRVDGAFQWKFAAHGTGAREAWVSIGGVTVAHNLDHNKTIGSKPKSSVAFIARPVTPGQGVSAFLYQNSGGALWADLPTTLDLKFY